MRTNGSRCFRRSDRAEVGVGTLIVFIAMVLVAAVAAAVLIGTSGTLQQRASQTGQEATAEVSSNFKIVGVYGLRNDTTKDVYNLKLYLELSAGATKIDMEQLVIRFSDGNSVRHYKYGTEPSFTLAWIRGSGTNNVLSSGDLLELRFNTVDAELLPRDTFELLLLPEVGSPVQLDVKMPSTYGDDLSVTLR